MLLLLTFLGTDPKANVSHSPFFMSLGSFGCYWALSPFKASGMINHPTSPASERTFFVSPMSCIYPPSPNRRWTLAAVGTLPSHMWTDSGQAEGWGACSSLTLPMHPNCPANSQPTTRYTSASFLDSQATTCLWTDCRHISKSKRDQLRPVQTRRNAQHNCKLKL